MILLVILGAFTVPAFTKGVESGKIVRTIGEIRMISTEIQMHHVMSGGLPQNLAEIGRGDLLDPWGRPYQYLNFTYLNLGDTQGQDQELGPAQKTRNLLPINLNFDLYSSGKDGKSAPLLSAQVCRDDVILGRNGAYIGLASSF